MINVQKMPTPLFVVAVALRDEAGRILMQKRALQGVHGGLWEFPGGKIEAGEMPESAAVREIGEELGVALALEDLQPVTFAGGSRGAGSDPEGGLVILLYTSCRWTGEPRCLDGEAIAWFGLSEISELAMPPLDYPLARGLEAMLERNSV